MSASLPPPLWRLAVFAQMFCLGAMLLGVPLYLTRQLGLDPGRAGVLVFALPMVMTVLEQNANLLQQAVGLGQAVEHA